MSSEHSSLRSLFERKVVVSPLVRVLLALTVMAGGLAFVATGAMVLFSKPAGAYPSPAGVALLSVAMVAAGMCFLWIGMRLVRAQAAMNNLLSFAARRRCSLIVGGLAVSMLAFAVEERSALFLTTAAGLVVFSYFIFPLAEH